MAIFPSVQYIGRNTEVWKPSFVFLYNIHILILLIWKEIFLALMCLVHGTYIDGSSEHVVQAWSNLGLFQKIDLTTFDVTRYLQQIEIPDLL